MALASLESICERISSGGTPSRKNADYFTNTATGHLWVKSKELLDCAIDDTEERITDDGLKNSSAKYYPVHTVLLAMYGANVGQLGWLRKPATVNQAICGLVVDEQQADWRFVLYSLLLNRGDLTIQAQGAAQQNLNQDLIRQFCIDLPPLTVQQRIAGILSTYDELIENSLRRIKILETMARTLYREWFVHFRFPGHEDHLRVASPLGEIPQGWNVKRVTDSMQVNPRVVVPRDGQKPFVPMGCLSTDSMLIAGIESRDGNSGAKFQNGDTLFARITPCLENGKTGFVQFLPDANAVAFGSTEFIVLRSATLTPEFVYCLARSDEFRGVAIKSMSGATGRQRVQEKCFDDLQIVHPPELLLGKFAAIVAPSFRLIYSLHLQIQNLRRTRDLLLPRLLSGQIDVEALAA